MAERHGGKTVNAELVRLLACTGPYGSIKLRLPDYSRQSHMKVERLLALLTGHLHTQEIYLVESICNVMAHADVREGK